MQDGAPVHTSKSAISFLQSKCKLVPGWPPNSPDLNPIEIVWSIIKRRLKRHNIRTKNELIEFVLKIWNGIDQDLLNKLVKDFNRRIKLVIEVHGCSISQYISSHFTTPKYFEDEMVERRCFNKDDDESIMWYVGQIGPKWKLISQAIGWPTPTQVKNRYHMLLRIERNTKLDSIIELPPIEMLIQQMKISF